MNENQTNRTRRPFRGAPAAWMTAKAAATVDMIRGSLADVTDADVFVSSGGDALIWATESVIHVDTNGTPVTFTTGWDV